MTKIEKEAAQTNNRRKTKDKKYLAVNRSTLITEPLHKQNSFGDMFEISKETWSFWDMRVFRDMKGLNEDIRNVSLLISAQ